MRGKNQCEHGNLARKCEICELKSELDLCHQSMAKMAKMYPVVDAARKLDEHRDGFDHWILESRLHEALRALDGEP